MNVCVAVPTLTTIWSPTATDAGSEDTLSVTPEVAPAVNPLVRVDAQLAVAA